jgi:hypothetical protein
MGHHFAISNGLNNWVFPCKLHNYQSPQSVAYNPKVSVIACAHTADLSYWSQAVDHIVVVVGIDDEQIYLYDPSLSDGSQPVAKVEFELAQLNYDRLCAIIQS